MRIAILEHYPSKTLNMPIYMGVPREPYVPHADIMAKYLNDLGPGCEIDLLPNDRRGLRLLQNGDYQIAVMSSQDLFFYIDTDLQMEKEIAKHTLLVTAAGNDGRWYSEHGEKGAALREPWVVIGACSKDGVPREFSSYGEWKIFGMGIDNYFENVADSGTSFAAPYWTSVVMHYYSKFKEVFGYYPSPESAKEWAKINSHDIWEEGYDIKCGYGLIKIPRIWEFEEKVITLGSDTVITNKYREVNGKVSADSHKEVLDTPLLLSDTICYKDEENKQEIPKWTLYGPLRFAGESVGAKVWWDNENKQAHFSR